MTYAAGQAEPNESPILHAAIALAPAIRALGDEIEQGRRIPASVVHAMKDAGIFGMPMPRAWGGPELDPLTQFRVLEALAMADGSVGWCAMINCDGGYITAFLHDDVGRAMYPDLQAGTAAAATPTGQALRVPGGYRVSGRFPFASGCQHCDWVWVGCVVVADGKPLEDSHGVPETRQCLVRLAQCEILDTWYTTGLRGTGSHDLLVKEVFVEAAHTFSFQDTGSDQAPRPTLRVSVHVCGQVVPSGLGDCAACARRHDGDRHEQGRTALYAWRVSRASQDDARRCVHSGRRGASRHDAHLRTRPLVRGHGRPVEHAGQWQGTQPSTGGPVHHGSYLRRRRLRGGRATRL